MKQHKIEKIKENFKNGTLFVKSVNVNTLQLEFKPINRVLKHFTITKDIYQTTLSNGKKVTTTEDHNLFKIQDNKLHEVKPIENPKEIVYIENDIVKTEHVKNLKKKCKKIWMYDLEIETNHNFALTSGILVCNSFSPPASETNIHGFTQTRGFRWPDEQLYLHLIMAVNYINLIPPDTDFDIENYPAPWQPLMLQIAMAYALWDLAILWINEEFTYSLNGISLDLMRSDKYQSAASALLDQANTQLEVAKRRIHIIKGLRQSRYIFGFGSGYLGPWTNGTTIKRWAYGSQYGRSVRGFF